MKRARRQGFVFHVFLCVLCVGVALFLLGYALVVGLLAPGGLGVGARLGFGGFLALNAIPFVLLAHWIRRRYQPRRARHLGLSVAPTQLPRGGAVEVTLTLLKPRKAGKALELGLVCNELYEEPRYVGGPTTACVTVQHVEHEEWREVSRTETYQRHRFVVPVSAPYSHPGEKMSFVWRVSARERAGRLRYDPTVDEEIEVSP